VSATKQYKQLLVLVLLLGLISSACKPSGPSPEELASTMVVQTANAASPTHLPTEVPLPTATATPAPLLIQDDFSSQSDIWGDCEECVWKDGALYFGPYPPNPSMGQDQLFYMLCEACGKHTYYRISADVSHFDGFSDRRTFGLLAGLTDDNILWAGTITTSGHTLYEAFNFNKKEWGGTDFKLFDSVSRGKGAINHIEVEIIPGSFAKSANITIKVNGEKNVYLENQPIEPTVAGLYLGWHTVGIKYDNFKYEEIWP
jgi:hypothetical protein